MVRPLTALIEHFRQELILLTRISRNHMFYFRTLTSAEEFAFFIRGFNSLLHNQNSLAKGVPQTFQLSSFTESNCLGIFKTFKMNTTYFAIIKICFRKPINSSLKELFGTIFIIPFDSIALTFVFILLEFKLSLFCLSLV